MSAFDTFIHVPDESKHSENALLTHSLSTLFSSTSVLFSCTPLCGVIYNRKGKFVEAALLSELEFKHQVTMARGREGGREVREGGMSCQGVQRTGSGMKGGEGEV